jgi:hypothetical protein
MRPFLFQDVFDINDRLQLQKATVGDVPVVLADNVLRQPALAREIAASSPATNWKHAPGGRNFVDYHDCRLRFPVTYPNRLVGVACDIIGQAWSTPVRPFAPHVDVNWFNQVNPRSADCAYPHHDVFHTDAKHSFTCLIYLNDASESLGGTAFYRYRPSGSPVRDPAYDRDVQQNPRLMEDGRSYWPDRPDEFWEQTGAAEMVPGRMIIFPAQYYHAAWHPRDGFFTSPRLTLVFWLGA